jgi:hypothetical protein
MVEFGSTIVKVVPLTWWEYAISILIGALGIVWGLILKLFPLSWFGAISIKEEVMNDE